MSLEHDSLDNLVIEVIDEDITGGSTDPEFCPVAMAIRRTYGPERVRTSVLWGVIVVDNTATGEHHEVTMPREVSDFVCAFDDGHDVKPFSFWLNVTD